MPYTNKQPVNLGTENFFLNELRNLTRPIQQRIEALPIALAMAGSTVNVPQYACYLQLLYQVHADVETHLFPELVELLPDIEQRRKSGWICNDLQFLGYPPPAAACSFFLKQSTAPAVPFLMGVLYATEGSTERSRQRFAHINTVRGFDAAGGASFLAGYGLETNQKWKSFLRLLCNMETSQRCGAAIIQGAKTGFERMLHLLDVTFNS